LKTKNIGGWSGYIAEHKKEGTVGQREHIAFLNMWLEKFVFYGKTFGPTANHQIVAERLAAGNHIPLGKYILGAVYYLLHQVAVSLSTNSPIGTLGGPWWFINMWLNLHLPDRLDQNIFAKTFPGDQPNGVQIVRRRCKLSLSFQDIKELLLVWQSMSEVSTLASTQTPLFSLHIKMMNPTLRPHSTLMISIKMMQIGLLL
jgi:hypothetical protein